MAFSSPYNRYRRRRPNTFSQRVAQARAPQPDRDQPDAMKPQTWSRNTFNRPTGSAFGGIGGGGSAPKQNYGNPWQQKLKDYAPKPLGSVFQPPAGAQRTQGPYRIPGTDLQPGAGYDKGPLPGTKLDPNFDPGLGKLDPALMTPEQKAQLAAQQGRSYFGNAGGQDAYYMDDETFAAMTGDERNAFMENVRAQITGDYNPGPVFRDMGEIPPRGALPPHLDSRAVPGSRWEDVPDLLQGGQPPLDYDDFAPPPMDFDAAEVQQFLGLPPTAPPIAKTFGPNAPWWNDGIKGNNPNNQPQPDAPWWDDGVRGNNPNNQGQSPKQGWWNDGIPNNRPGGLGGQFGGKGPGQGGAGAQPPKAPAPPQAGEPTLPLDPVFEQGRRLLEDELSATLAGIGASKKEIAAAIALWMARLEEDRAEALEGVDEAANARGIYNSGIRFEDRGDVYQQYQRAQQDFAAQMARQQRELAMAASQAQMGYGRGLQDLLLDVAGRAAQSGLGGATALDDLVSPRGGGGGGRPRAGVGRGRPQASGRGRGQGQGQGRGRGQRQGQGRGRGNQQRRRRRRRNAGGR